MVGHFWTTWLSLPKRVSGFHHTALTPPESWQVGFVKSLEISFLHCLSKVAPSYLSSPFPFVWVILGRRLSALGLWGPFGGRYMPLCLGFSLHTWVGLKSSARNIVRFFFATSELQRCLLCLHALFLDIRWQKMGNNGFDIKTIPNKHRSSASMQKQGHTDLRNRA